MKLRSAFFAFACLALPVGMAYAQQPQTPPPAQPQQGSDDVPKASRPPAGMCRIWLDKVPARQQPAPTDCPTAVRNRPSSGKVIFGDDYKDGAEKGEKRVPPFIQKFGEGRKKP